MHWPSVVGQFPLRGSNEDNQINHTDSLPTKNFKQLNQTQVAQVHGFVIAVLKRHHLRQMLVWREAQNGCLLVAPSKCDHRWGRGVEFQRCNELQPLCLCMNNYYVCIMLLNCVGTSHCGSLCSQSLCVHIWPELWSGRCAIYMPHTHSHTQTRAHIFTATALASKKVRHSSLSTSTKKIHTVILVFRDCFWYSIIKFTHLRLLRL